ncbi:MAG TPA: FAD-dependent oxidoreductase, partial [Magnetovibrio sp.]
MRRVHVIGAGLAGLSAALHLASKGVAVTIHEAAPQAGGRCRSFVDPVLKAVIDNGAHL